MMPAPSFLDTLKLAADQATRAEEDFRREIAERTKTLDRERAFAHRRLNFMRAIAETIASAENEEIAIAAATAVLCNKLGWSSESEARTDVIERFKPIAQQIFACLAPPEDDEVPPPDVVGALTAFEIWYRETHPNPFWVLFEHYMPDTPVVDF